jgi:protein tyrosine phosphatase (PTP) superfamily phosphohydrolase (DUF442 family)
MESTLPGTALASPPSASCRRGWVWLARIAVAVPLLVVLAEVAHVLFLGNFHVVIPGEVFRAAQPSGRDVERMVRQYDLRTVINLRGRGDGMAWYEDEARACQKLGVSHENLTFSASRLPSRTELNRLIELLDQAERPLVLHCRQGADRTGLAVAVLQLLQPGSSYREARAAMGLRWGHWRWGPAGELGGFFELYEGWLANAQIEHSAEAFRRWATTGYDGGYRHYEVIKMTPMQERPRVGQSLGYLVTFRNLGSQPWRFHAIGRAGVHIHAEVVADDGTPVSWHFGSMFEKTVPAGGEIELTAVVKPLAVGRYRLRIDLFDGERGQFFKFGQTPIEQELIVRE